MLPRALQRFAAEHPAVALGVRTGHSEELLELVLSEQIQIAIVRALRHAEIESTPLYEDEVVLATHPAHALAGDHAVRVEQLGEEELILFDPSSSYHELTSSMFRAAGVSPRGVMVLDSIDAAKRMVQLGLGIALLPRSALSDELDEGSLAAVAVVSTAPVRRQIVAIRRRDAGELAPALAALIESVRAVAAVRRQAGLYSPNVSRIAPQISPSVARARTAATIAGIALTSVRSQSARRACRAPSTAAPSRAARTEASRAICPSASAGSTWKETGLRVRRPRGSG